MSITVDTSKLSEQLEALGQALNTDGPALVRDETRRLGRTITNFVPPIKSKWGNAKESGLMAVKSELYSLISEAKPEFIKQLTGKGRKRKTSIDTTITTKGGKELQIKWENIDLTGKNLPELHKKYRNNRGKIQRRKQRIGVWSSRVVVPFGKRDRYVRKVQKSVGRAKASIAQACYNLGDTKGWPPFIKRHFGEVGNISVFDATKLNRPGAPLITFGSRAPGINRIEQRIRDAVRTRAQQVKRRAKLIVSGYNKDMARRMKIQAQSKREAWDQSIGFGEEVSE